MSFERTSIAGLSGPCAANAFVWRYFDPWSPVMKPSGGSTTICMTAKNAPIRTADPRTGIARNVTLRHRQRRHDRSRRAARLAVDDARVAGALPHAPAQAGAQGSEAQVP